MMFRGSTQYHFWDTPHAVSIHLTTNFGCQRLGIKFSTEGTRIVMQINSRTSIRPKKYNLIEGHSAYIQDVESLCTACEINDHKEVSNIIRRVADEGRSSCGMQNNDRSKIGASRLPRRLNHKESVFLDTMSCSGVCAIHEASRENSVESLGVLISHGADINRRCNRGRTALHIACYKGHTKIAKILLNHQKCDPAILDNAGTSVLHYAVIGKSYDCVLLLLLASAPKTLRDNNGKTPLQICRTQKIADLLNPSSVPKVSYFLDRNANLMLEVRDHVQHISSCMEKIYHSRSHFNFMTEVQRRFQVLEDGKWVDLNDEESLIGKKIEILRLDWKFESCKVVSYDHYNETWGIHLSEHELFGVLTKDDVFFVPGWFDFMWFILFRHFALKNRLKLGKIKVSGKMQDLVLANNSLEKNLLFLMTLHDDDDSSRSSSIAPKSSIFELILSFVGTIMRSEKENARTILNL